MAPLIQGIGIRKAFAGIEVLTGVDIELRGGEVHAIVGENGAGKSTLAKILAGVHRPDAGTVVLDAKPVRFDNPRQAIESGVALIHQEPLTFPDLEVAENIFVAHQPGGAWVDWPTMRTLAASLLDRLGVRLDLRTRVGELSVADQQMVELAFALSQRSRVFLFDETTASLTPSEVDRLFGIIRKLRDDGAAVAFVTHRLNEVFEIADRITVMRDGGKVAELVPEQSSASEVVRLMVGRDLDHSSRLQPAPSGGPPALSVKGLSGARFTDVSFEVEPGEILGMAGLVGAGRSEVARALFGIDAATGEVEVNGIRASIRSPRDAMGHGIALVPEDRQHDGLLMPLGIAENAVIASLSGFFTSRKRDIERVGVYADRFGLVRRSLDQPVRELSGGNQQKVAIAKWLLTDPGILILDEPTRGVDVGAKAEVHRLIRELAAEGMAILMISSDLNEVVLMSDRVVVIREGRLAGVCTGAQIEPNTIMMIAAGQEAA